MTLLGNNLYFLQEIFLRIKNRICKDLRGRKKKQGKIYGNRFLVGLSARNALIGRFLNELEKRLKV